MSARRLRVLSVVTLVSPDGEYGGPVRVALNQAAALRDAGHEVTIAGAARGFGGRAPDRLAGVPARLFPARTALPGTGFAGLAAPGLWRWVRAHVRDFDVVHVHVARDLVTLPAARIVGSAGVPYVCQPHGMIDPSQNPLARPLDAVLTRPVLRGARNVLHLTDVERRGLLDVAGPDLPLVHVPNGVPRPEHTARADVPTVLYLARLAPRKRPVHFVEMARAVAVKHPGTRFVMVGPDEGEGQAVREALARAREDGIDISWTGPAPPERTLEEMLAASVYVLPSVDEPYPMSVLEAMSVALPVVITDSCGLAQVVSSARAGVVVDDSAEALAAAVQGLLSDPGEAAAMGASGREHVGEHLSMSSIAAQLEDLYLGLGPA